MTSLPVLSMVTISIITSNGNNGLIILSVSNHSNHRAFIWFKNTSAQITQVSGRSLQSFCRGSQAAYGAGLENQLCYAQQEFKSPPQRLCFSLDHTFAFHRRSSSSIHSINFFSSSICIIYIIYPK